MRRTKPGGVHYAVIRVYDAAGNVIETHEHTGGFQSVVNCAAGSRQNRF
ncbi:MAG: hypothetical protein ACREFF_04290 [Candidatus Udaeobacter sp.]